MDLRRAYVGGVTTRKTVIGCILSVAVYLEPLCDCI
jgi:hypothetical protein